MGEKNKVLAPPVIIDHSKLIGPHLFWPLVFVIGAMIPLSQVKQYPANIEAT